MILIRGDKVYCTECHHKVDYPDYVAMVNRFGNIHDVDAYVCCCIPCANKRGWLKDGFFQRWEQEIKQGVYKFNWNNQSLCIHEVR